MGYDQDKLLTLYEEKETLEVAQATLYQLLEDELD